MIFNFLELDIEYDDKSFFEKTAVENLNKLFAILNQMYRGKKHLIILLDEVIINHDCTDFSGLQLDHPFITIILAINPAGYDLTKEIVIKPPSKENVLAVQLKTKNCNSYQIANLIAHINKLSKEKGGSYKYLDSANDKPLDPSNLPNGPLPNWIQRSPDTTDEDVLKYLKTKFLPEAESVTLVHFQKKFSQKARDWLSNQGNWKVMSHLAMTGSETECLVAFIENTYFNMETFSRAKKQLIIVTK